jgi:hypothetical protein
VVEAKEFRRSTTRFESPAWSSKFGVGVAGGGARMEHGESQGEQKGPAALPSEPSARAKEATKHAVDMLGQTDPAIWFDSWSNDWRDNDFNGQVDDALERGKEGVDGYHYKDGRTYYGLVTANWLTLPQLRARSVPWHMEKVKVDYKVCIDIPRESYAAVLVPIPDPMGRSKRMINDFFHDLKGIHGWAIWEKKSKAPEPSLLTGDIIAWSPSVAHGHCGIILGGAINQVVHLPGPSRRWYTNFAPTSRNDIRINTVVEWRAVLGIDLVARWTLP